MAHPSASDNRIDREPSAYIGTKPACGCTVAIVVDDGLYPKDVGRCVSEFIVAGYEVKRVTLAEGIALLGSCPHKQQGQA